MERLKKVGLWCISVVFLLALNMAAYAELELKFDFGNGPVEPGYIGVPHDVTVEQGLGYGFNSPCPNAFWFGWEGILLDLVGGYGPADGNRTFTVGLPAGYYDIEVTTWDFGGNRDFRILAEGAILDESVVLTAWGTRPVTKTYTNVLVKDGALDLAFDGKSDYWLLAALRITLVQEVAQTQWNFDFGNGPVYPGYVGVTHDLTLNQGLGYGFNSPCPNAFWFGWEGILLDLVGGSGASGIRTFTAGLTSGFYDIEVITWDFGGNRDFRILAEGAVLDESVILTAWGPRPITKTYTNVLVDDGALELTFDGKNDYWLLAALRIELILEIEDADNDGFDNTQDCNDNDATIYPGSTEHFISDGIIYGLDMTADDCAVIDVAAIYADCQDPTPKNHGQYVSCIAHAADVLLENGQIDDDIHSLIVSTAAKSAIGRK